MERQDLVGLLAELEALDGAIEADVVRSALEAGVPEVVVLEQLQQEVERRRLRAQELDASSRDPWR